MVEWTRSKLKQDSWFKQTWNRFRSRELILPDGLYMVDGGLTVTMIDNKVVKNYLEITLDTSGNVIINSTERYNKMSNEGRKEFVHRLAFNLLNNFDQSRYVNGGTK
jgi:hypothetical protein